MKSYLFENIEELGTVMESNGVKFFGHAGLDTETPARVMRYYAFESWDDYDVAAHGGDCPHIYMEALEHRVTVDGHIEEGDWIFGPILAEEERETLQRLTEELGGDKLSAVLCWALDCEVSEICIKDGYTYYYYYIVEA